MDGNKGQAPVMAQTPFKGKSKGAGKSKSPSKGSKGKTSTASKGPSGKSRARSAMVCLRCGKPGHFAANCPTAQGSGSTSPKKRPAEDDSMIHMALHLTELYDAEEFFDVEDPYDSEVFYDIEEAYTQGETLVRAGGWLTPEPDSCIQDQGASSFLAGSEYILRYLKWLELIGYPMEDIAFKRCDKSFRFGGDATGHSLDGRTPGTTGRHCRSLAGLRDLWSHSYVVRTTSPRSSSG